MSPYQNLHDKVLSQSSPPPPLILTVSNDCYFPVFERTRTLKPQYILTVNNINLLKCDNLLLADDFIDHKYDFIVVVYIQIMFFFATIAAAAMIHTYTH